jgi:hypothetical protein
MNLFTWQNVQLMIGDRVVLPGIKAIGYRDSRARNRVWKGRHGNRRARAIAEEQAMEETLASLRDREYPPGPSVPLDLGDDCNERSTKP